MSFNRNSKCFCGSGKKYKFCCGSKYLIHPDSLIGRLIRGYSAIEHMVAKEDITSNLPCKSGCSSCCTKNLFPIGFVEFEYLKYGLQNLPVGKINRLKDRIINQRIILSERGPEVFDNPTNFPKPEFKGEWDVVMGIREQIYKNAGNIPCPLLEDNSCIMYKYRPYTCRVHGFFRSGSGSSNCDLIDDSLVKNQITLPEHLFLMKILGIWYVGRPIIAWLSEQLDLYGDLTTTDINGKRTFETPASMIRLGNNQKVPDSSLHLQ